MSSVDVIKVAPLQVSKKLSLIITIAKYRAAICGMLKDKIRLNTHTPLTVLNNSGPIMDYQRVRKYISGQLKGDVQTA